jgi:hypothetical protein
MAKTAATDRSRKRRTDPAPAKLLWILGGVGCLGLAGMGVVVAIVAIVIVGNSSLPLDIAGTWPEPMPINADPNRIVIFHVAGVEDEYTREEVQGKISNLADKPAPGQVNMSTGAYEKGRLTVRLTPCDDVAAAAKKVDFGKVRSVSGRVVTVMADKVQGPAANDPVTLSFYYLKSAHKGKRDDAVRKLRTITPDNRRAQVAKALEALLNDPSQFTRAEAAQTLGAWGTKENVPALLAVLQDTEFVARHGAIEALSKIKDERAIEPIAARLENAADRHTAGKALKDFGPAAEKPVMARLTHPEMWTKVEACHILRVIGTRQCLPAVQRLTNDPDVTIRNAAQDTVKVLQGKNLP